MINANPMSTAGHGRCHNEEQALLEDIAYAVLDPRIEYGDR